MDTPVNSTDTTNAASENSSSAAIAIAGKVVTIMETWPLQLVVETESQPYHVTLLPETIIKTAGQTTDVTALKTNQVVRISGYTTTANTLTAELIETQN